MLLFYINFGDRNPPYPALGFNIPSARREGQRFHFLQCRGSSPSLRFVNRHGGTLRRAGWVAFTKTYSRGKWLISHLPPTFAVIIHIPRPPRPRPTRPRVPYLMSSSPSSRVPTSQVPIHASRCPRPLVSVPLLYTANLRSMSHYWFFFDFHVTVFTRSSWVRMKTWALVVNCPKIGLQEKKQKK